MRRIPETNRRVLADALRRRREEVEALLGHDPPAPAPAAPSEAGDVEEALLVLMVRLWPGVRDGRATPDEADAMLRRLREVATVEDLRCLDAWNNAYETVFRVAWSGPGRRPDTGAHLALYRSLLLAWEQRLEGER